MAGHRRQHQPEAVENQRPCCQRHGESDGLTQACRLAHVAEGDADHDRADDHIHQTPYAHLADTDQKLSILWLGEGEIQCTLAHVFDQLLHAGLHHHAQDATHQSPHPHQHHQFRWRPAIELIGVVEDDEHSEQGESEIHRRPHKLNPEIGAVLDLIHRPKAREDGQQAKQVHAPTAE